MIDHTVLIFEMITVKAAVSSAVRTGISPVTLQRLVKKKLMVRRVFPHRIGPIACCLCGNNGKRKLDHSEPDIPQPVFGVVYPYELTRIRGQQPVMICGVFSFRQVAGIRCGFGGPSRCDDGNV